MFHLLNACVCLNHADITKKWHESIDHTLDIIVYGVQKSEEV